MFRKNKSNRARFVVVVYDTYHHKFSTLSPQLVSEAVARLKLWQRLTVEQAMRVVIRDGKESVEKVEHVTTVVDGEVTKHFVFVQGHGFSLQRRLGRSDIRYGEHLVESYGETNGRVIMNMIAHRFPDLAKQNA